jgi:hypothetical protein
MTMERLRVYNVPNIQENPQFNRKERNKPKYRIGLVERPMSQTHAMTREEVEHVMKRGSCAQILGVLESGRIETQGRYREPGQAISLPEDLQEGLAQRAYSKRKLHKRLITGASFAGVIALAAIGAYITSGAFVAVLPTLVAAYYVARHLRFKTNKWIETTDAIMKNNVTSAKAMDILYRMAREDSRFVEPMARAEVTTSINAQGFYTSRELEIKKSKPLPNGKVPTKVRIGTRDEITADIEAELEQQAEEEATHTARA